jgi:SNF2 family DNA or RNA helicase
VSKPFDPHDYQLTAIQFGIENPHFGLFQEPGLGKTSETYAIYTYLKRHDGIEKMLVVCPLRPAHRVWPEEAKKWTEFSKLRVVVLHGPKKDALLRTPHDVAVINPEGLEWLLGFDEEIPVLDERGKRVMNPRTGKPRMTKEHHAGAAETAGVWWDMLTVDESTRFKHANTVRSRTLRPHLSRFKRRAILTGSPAPNGLLDLFGQVLILDMGRALGRHITAYRQQFFNPTGFGGYTWVPKDDAAEQIYARLRPLVLRMAAADYLDLPPLVPNNIWVDLPPAARRQYDSMEKLLMAAVDDELVTAANVAAATMKCRQIAGGGMYADGGTAEWHHLHEAKTEAVCDLVEELSGQPALIAYEFKHELERLQRALKKVVGEVPPFIGGGVTTKRMAELETAWNLGRLPVLLAQPQSVAHGLNLQGTSAAVIFHSSPWDLETDEQFIRRVWRQGQKSRVVVHRIAARDTVDVAILKSLAKKDKTQRTLLAALQDYARDGALAKRAKAGKK